MAKTTNKPAAPTPPGAKEKVVHMDGARRLRFFRTLTELCDAVESLKTSVQHFPDPECNPGEMEPRVTALAFASRMDELIGLALAMANDEDHLNENQRDDHHE